MTAIEFNHQLVGMESNLQRFALSLTSNPEEARDLIQETYVKAISYRNKFTDYSNLKGWVFTIMKNTFINNYRKSAYQNTTIDQTPDLYHLNLPQESGFASPDGAYAIKEIGEWIGNLDDEFRIPFEMHFKGYKYKEIAEHLNLPIGTVKSRIFFARKKLMKDLNDFRN